MSSGRKHTLQVTDDMIPLSQFKTQASKVLSGLHENGRTIVITQNGKPSAVVMTPEEFDRLCNRGDFMTAVDEGRKDARKKRVYGTSEVEKELDRKFGKLK